MRPQACYFPVQPTPLKMVAGLRRFGVDCGQGELDRQFFQRDEHHAAYVAAKRLTPANRHGSFGDDPASVRAREAALVFMRDTLAREQPELLARADADAEARDGFEAIARAVQEDFAVLTAGAHELGSTVALDVRFPSGWRPERLVGASFAALHEPVPGFADSAAAVRSMVRAMIDRGPYVRFVWTLCSDDALDHHPDTREKADFRAAKRLWLRVERQLTVGLPAAQASVFLIRTYLYPCDQLGSAERLVLLEALGSMPDEIRAYKGLPRREDVEQTLSHAAGTPDLTART
jgi:dimethylamine monooxygenase subunit A